ncbi:MAG: hypothetical protein ACXADL_06725 [Candidatus Thorarchaeota archaeon]
MSDEDVRRMIEEATKEEMKQSFTEAGRKYVEAAEVSERKGDFPGAEGLYIQGAESYTKAAEEYRSSKSYKIAALNMCLAGDVYSELGNTAQAVSSYEIAAEDLLGASKEHLMWGEDVEVKKGTALAMTACMLYLMIGREADAFYKARSFSAENASKLIFPQVVQMSQIPQMIEGAIQSMNLEAFSGAERAAVTELKSALTSAGAQEFSQYIDKGLDMVREILRGKLKVPKLSAHLDLPIDMTFSEEFPLRLQLQNTGDGDALNVSAEWRLDEGISLVSGETKKVIPNLRAGTTANMDIRVRSSEQLAGQKEFSVVVRGTYSDQLNTEYSLQAGPGSFVLKDFKESEKLLQDVDVTGGRVALLDPSIDESSIEAQMLKPISAKLAEFMKDARNEVEQKHLDSAKARIKIANEMVDAIDATLGDEVIARQIEDANTVKNRAFARKCLEEVRSQILDTMTSQEQKMDREVGPTLEEWDADAAMKRKLSEAIAHIAVSVSALVSELEAIQAEMPPASTTDDPTLAAKRTKLRTAMEDAKSKLSNVSSRFESVKANSSLTVGPRPETPAKIEMAMVVLRSVVGELTQILDSKKTELQ